MIDDIKEAKFCSNLDYIKQFIKGIVMEYGKTYETIDDGKISAGETTGDSLPGMYDQVVCPCCNGKGFQFNKQTEINEPCRCCESSGIGLPGQGNFEIGTTANPKWK